MNLYSLNAEYECLFDKLSHLDEISNEDLESLNNLESSLQDKAIACIGMALTWEAQAKSIKEALDKMKDRFVAYEHKSQKMINHVHDILKKHDLLEVQSPYFDIKVVKNPCKPDLYCENDIPDEFKVRKETISFDKVKIREALKNNINVPGARLIQETRLSIK